MISTFGASPVFTRLFSHRLLNGYLSCHLLATYRTALHITLSGSALYLLHAFYKYFTELWPRVFSLSYNILARSVICHWFLTSGLVS